MSYNQIIGKAKQGVCPKCKTTDIEYGIIELGGNTIVYPFGCRKCNFKGEEVYDLKFNHMIDKTEEV